MKVFCDGNGVTDIQWQIIHEIELSSNHEILLSELKIQTKLASGTIWGNVIKLVQYDMIRLKTKHNNKQGRQPRLIALTWDYQTKIFDENSPQIKKWKIQSSNPPLIPVINTEINNLCNEMEKCLKLGLNKQTVSTLFNLIIKSIRLLNQGGKINE